MSSEDSEEEHMEQRAPATDAAAARPDRPAHSSARAESSARAHSAQDAERIRVREPLGPRGGLALARLVPTMTQLRSLDLSDTSLALGTGGRSDFSALDALAAALLATGRLEVLRLARNGIDCRGCGSLEALLDGTALGELDLRHNAIWEEGARVLAASLSRSSSTLAVLRLGGNAVRDRGARHFGRMLGANKSLSLLDLSHNFIFDSGVRYLCRGLHTNGALRELRLQGNKTGLRAKYVVSQLATTVSSAGKPGRPGKPGKPGKPACRVLMDEAAPSTSVHATREEAEVELTLDGILAEVKRSGELKARLAKADRKARRAASALVSAEEKRAAALARRSHSDKHSPPHSRDEVLGLRLGDLQAQLAELKAANAGLESEVAALDEDAASHAEQAAALAAEALGLEDRRRDVEASVAHTAAALEDMRAQRATLEARLLERRREQASDREEVTRLRKDAERLRAALEAAELLRAAASAEAAALATGNDGVHAAVVALDAGQGALRRGAARLKTQTLVLEARVAESKAVIGVERRAVLAEPVEDFDGDKSGEGAPSGAAPRPQMLRLESYRDDVDVEDEVEEEGGEEGGEEDGEEDGEGDVSTSAPPPSPKGLPGVEPEMETKPGTKLATGPATMLEVVATTKKGTGKNGGSQELKVEEVEEAKVEPDIALGEVAEDNDADELKVEEVEEAELEDFEEAPALPPKPVLGKNAELAKDQAVWLAAAQARPAVVVDIPKRRQAEERDDENDDEDNDGDGPSPPLSPRPVIREARKQQEAATEDEDEDEDEDKDGPSPPLSPRPVTRRSRKQQDAAEDEDEDGPSPPLSPRPVMQQEAAAEDGVEDGPSPPLSPRPVINVAHKQQEATAEDEDEDEDGPSPPLSPRPVPREACKQQDAAGEKTDVDVSETKLGDAPATSPDPEENEDPEDPETAMMRVLSSGGTFQKRDGLRWNGPRFVRVSEDGKLLQWTKGMAGSAKGGHFKSLPIWSICKVTSHGTCTDDFVPGPDADSEAKEMEKEKEAAEGSTRSSGGSGRWLRRLRSKGSMKGLASADEDKAKANKAKTKAVTKGKLKSGDAIIRITGVDRRDSFQLLAQDATCGADFGPALQRLVARVLTEKRRKKLAELEAEEEQHYQAQLKAHADTQVLAELRSAHARQAEAGVDAASAKLDEDDGDVTTTAVVDFDNGEGDDEDDEEEEEKERDLAPALSSASFGANPGGASADGLQKVRHLIERETLCDDDVDMPTYGEIRNAVAKALRADFSSKAWRAWFRIAVDAAVADSASDADEFDEEDSALDEPDCVMQDLDVAASSY